MLGTTFVCPLLYLGLQKYKKYPKFVSIAAAMIFCVARSRGHGTKQSSCFHQKMCVPRKRDNKVRMFYPNLLKCFKISDATIDLPNLRKAREDALLKE